MEGWQIRWIFFIYKNIFLYQAEPMVFLKNLVSEFSGRVEGAPVFCGGRNPNLLAKLDADKPA